MVIEDDKWLIYTIPDSLICSQKERFYLRSKIHIFVLRI